MHTIMNMLWDAYVCLTIILCGGLCSGGTLKIGKHLPNVKEFWLRNYHFYEGSLVDSSLTWRRTSIHRLMFTLTNTYVGLWPVCGHMCMDISLYDVVKHSMGVCDVMSISILCWFLLIHVSLILIASLFIDSYCFMFLSNYICWALWLILVFASF